MIAWPFCGGLGVLAVCCLAKSGPRAYDLTWRPHQGQVLRYRISMDMQLEGTEINLDADLLEAVRRKNPNGPFEVTSTTKHLRVISGGEIQSLPDEPSVTESYDAVGRRSAPTTVTQARSEPDPFSQVMESSTDFRPPSVPVKVAAKWSQSVSGDRKAGRRSARLDYRFVGIGHQGKIPVIHIKFAFTETEGEMRVKSDGYFLIDSRDNSILNSEATVHNARISPDTEPGTVAVRMRRAF